MTFREKICRAVCAGDDVWYTTAEPDNIYAQSLHLKRGFCSTDLLDGGDFV